jgi:hypothetical protein
VHWSVFAQKGKPEYKTSLLQAIRRGKDRVKCADLQQADLRFCVLGKNAGLLPYLC